MKYLLFTTPKGGWFPSLANQKVIALNRFRTQLAAFKKEVVPDIPDVSDLVEVLEDSLTDKKGEVSKEASVQRPGVYQWHEAFNKGKDSGEIAHTLNIAPMDLEKYDIIHINGCGSDIDLVPKIKQVLRGSSTVVIFNMDYAIENFQQGFPNVQFFYKSIALADFVFAVEPAQQAWLNFIMHYLIEPKRLKVNVPIIRHPCDVQGIRGGYVSPDERLDRIVWCYHRYDKHVYLPNAISWNLEAYHPKMPSKVIKVPVYMAGMGGVAVVLDMFDGWFTYRHWMFYLYELAHSTIGAEYYTIHSHSRFPEECAVLGIPCVGTDRAFSILKLHPYTCHSMLDFVGMRHSLERLVGDKEFYEKCVDYAWEHVQELDHEPSKMKLLFEMNRWLVAEGKTK